MKATALSLWLGLFSTPTFAIGEMLLENINVNLSSEGGEMTGSNLYVSSFPYQFHDVTPNVVVTKNNNQYSVDVGDDMIFKYYAGENSIFDNFGELAAEDLNLYFHTKRKLKIDFDGLRINVGQGFQNIPTMSLHCEATQGATVPSYVVPCLSYTRIHIPVLKLDELSQEGAKEALNTKKALNKFENVYFNINNGYATASLKTKIVFNVKVKMEGPISYDEETGELVMVLKKAKAGWLSVKGTILKTLREMDSKTVTVVGDSIRIKLGEAS
jgi:hypothetical protein